LTCVNEENSINEQSARGHSGIKSGRKAAPQSIFSPKDLNKNLRKNDFKEDQTNKIDSLPQGARLRQIREVESEAERLDVSQHSPRSGSRSNDEYRKLGAFNNRLAQNMNQNQRNSDQLQAYGFSRESHAKSIGGVSSEKVMMVQPMSNDNFSQFSKPSDLLSPQM